MANTDVLTGLANRRFTFNYGESKLALANKENQAFTVIIFDVDHFKAVNDNYGHAGGDIALVDIANIANHYVREQDILGRIGGEEFLLVLPFTSAKKAVAVAERIRVAIESNRFLLNEKHVQITASFGIAERTTPGQSFNDIFNQADTALYQAKASGRNRVEVVDIPQNTS